MKEFAATYWPEGGRFGYGYDFKYPVCGEIMNIMVSEEFVIHPEVKRKLGGLFSKSVSVPCEYSGKKLVFTTLQWARRFVGLDRAQMRASWCKEASVVEVDEALKGEQMCQPFRNHENR